MEVISKSPVAVVADSGPGTRGVYGRTFVGRENEIAQLRSAFDAAMAGKGSLTFVVGEPGIGKTSFCEQLANYVALRGGKTLVGHCYEEGSLSLPYLPFIEVVRRHSESKNDEDLRKELGSGASDVARNLAGAKLLIVGTYRDVEVDRSHPLSSSLAELRRVATIARIHCIGLTGDEVQKMLSAASASATVYSPSPR